MTVVAIIIGNSDDKLPQAEWNLFVSKVDQSVAGHAEEIFFTGAPASTAQWQNSCWVAEIRRAAEIRHLKEELIYIGHQFRQESIAWIQGESELLPCSQFGHLGVKWKGRGSGNATDLRAA